MSAMRADDSRLIKAARRTFRAEATLVVFIVIIFSWSIYGIYKFSVGTSDSIFGIQLTTTSTAAAAAGATSSQIEDKTSLQPSAPGTARKPIVPSPSLAASNTFARQSQRQQLARLQAELLWPNDHNAANVAPFNSNRRESKTASARLGAASQPAITYERVRRPSRARLPEDNIDQKLSLMSSRQAFEDDNERDFGESRGDSSLASGINNRDESVQPDYSQIAAEQPATNSQATGENQETQADYSDELDATQPQQEAKNDDLGQTAGQLEAGEPDSELEPETSARPSDRSDQSEPHEQATKLHQQDQHQQPAQADESESDSEEEEDETPKDTGRVIDEEVDRMTQPSSGVVTQQERPIIAGRTTADDDRNEGVQFDDLTPETSPLVAGKRAGQQTGDGGRQPVRAKTVASKKPASKDLEFDHNTPRVISSPKNPTMISIRRPAQAKLIHQHQHQMTQQLLKNMTSKLSKPTKPEPISKDTRRVTRLRGGKLGRPLTRPEDVDDYLKTVRFDDPLGTSASEVLPILSDPMLSSASQQLALEQLVPSYILHPNFTTDSDSRLAPVAGDLHGYPIAQIEGEPTSSEAPISVDQNKDIVHHRKRPEAKSSATAPTVENPSAADSLYTVDHGLLLYPSSDSGYKSKKSHKKGGHKKKMTIAYKKGGQKKKKHEKEEKKFIKEKKFKGAKKGKKIKKGKGGQGGKKGKKKFKDKGYKKKGFKNVYHKEEYGQKKSYFDEFRDKDFKKKWKKYDDNYKYAQMKKWQAKDVKGAKKMKDHGEKMKKYNKSRWKKTYQKDSKEDKHSKKHSF